MLGLLANLLLVKVAFPRGEAAVGLHQNHVYTGHEPLVDVLPSPELHRAQAVEHVREF